MLKDGDPVLVIGFILIVAIAAWLAYHREERDDEGGSR